MAGGGKSGPTSSTVTQTNVPEWLRPQVETLVGGATKELFTTQRTPDGAYEITGVKPYTPYSTKPEEYVAGFSPLQEQAFAGTAGLQTPGQFGMGTQMSQQAGLGGLSTAQQAAGLSGMQAGAGNQYMQMATNPFATQAFMSPYMQNVVDVQKQQAVQDYARQIPGLQAQGIRAGARGGTREALLQSEAQRNLMNQLGGIQAQGSQTAFQQAQQQFNVDAARALQAQQANQQAQLQAQQQALGQRGAMAQYGLGGADLAERSRQFGANLGLQGIQQQLAAAQALGNIGQTEYGQQMGINQAQMATGQQLQALEQQQRDMAYQEFLNRQRYPYAQLGFISDVIRGTPASGALSTMYQAPPSPLSQVAGLGALYYGSQKQ